MKQILLIAGYRYYPSKGSGDWVGFYESEEEIESQIKIISKNDTNIYEIDGVVYDWYEVVDLRKRML